MLTKLKVRCPYCNRASFFYVHEWRSKTHAAFWTECPKCHSFDDAIYVPAKEYEKQVVVLTGKEKPEKKS
jgi:hypothetical protein